MEELWLYFIAASLRLFLLKNLGVKLDLFGRAEVATPIASYSRLVEGRTLFFELGLDPYSGVLFHEPPIVLHLSRLLPEFLTDSTWIFSDLLTAFALGKVAAAFVRRLLSNEAKNKKDFHEDAKELLLVESKMSQIPKYVQIAYLFNPYNLLANAAKTTTCWENLVLALFLLAFIRKKPLFACLTLALISYKAFYPVMLLVPLCMIMAEDDPQNRLKTALKIVTTFALACSTLLYVSYALMGYNWSFLWSTYGFILSVPELTPNMGLFWYFFTEMFEHFRVFFVWTFQINIFIYVIPLSIRLRKAPFLLVFSLIGLIAVFKSYPSYGDVGFYLSLLPALAHLAPYTKQLFIVICMFLATTVLGPLLYHLWIYNGSANANYFFAITLVFNTAQIFLITDFLFAHIKREFYLRRGFKELRSAESNKNGPRLILK